MKNEPCAYCGENKWENQMKHWNEFMEFMLEKQKTLESFLGYNSAQKLRAIPSKKRAQASRENGKKGGRPKKNKTL